MRELNVTECQEISGGIGFPTWCATKCFLKSPTGIAILALGVAAVIGAYLLSQAAE